MKTDELRRKLETDIEEDTVDQEFECYMTEPAEITDLDELCEIDEFTRDNPARRKLIEKAIHDKQCWLVADSKQVLAYGIFDYSYKNQGTVRLIHVQEEYRRQGVGGEMLMTFESQCESKKIYATVPRNNLAAQELVKRVGYSEAGVPPRGDIANPDIIYVKDLWSPAAAYRPDRIQ